MTLKMRGAAAAAALALLIAGCGGASSEQTTTSSTAPAVTTYRVETTTTVTDSSLADGDHFVFLRDVGEASLTMDPAVMLSGEEARKAAVADGVISEGEDLPNDYYIHNPDSRYITVSVADNVVVTLIVSTASGLSDKELVFAELIAAWQGELEETIYGLTPELFPMLITVEGGVVTAARQQYVP